MKRSSVGMILAITALLGIAALVPASAQAETTLPPLAPLSSVRINYVNTFNGEPGIVCQEDWSAAPVANFHGTCHELVTAQVPEIGVDLTAGRTVEYVYYDGVYYERVNNEATWVGSRDPDYNPQLTINDALFAGYLYPTDSVISDLGRVTLEGTATTQYQFWSTDSVLNELSGGQYVYDVFVSDAGLVLKDQTSERGTFPALGEGELARIWTYTNFNQAITIAPPPAASVQMVSATRAPLTVSPVQALR